MICSFFANRLHLLFTYDRKLVKADDILTYFYYFCCIEIINLLKL